MLAFDLWTPRSGLLGGGGLFNLDRCGRTQVGFFQAANAVHGHAPTPGIFLKITFIIGAFLL